ncbi:homocysteine S-methyltransferase family protein [Syntrophothermus lipocalidus]|uniref:Methionine synthase n=1 Tax=Syntrophothermus lipocalidus (strain DSM 12680 / TGB-C1) TaxID=643648 RepID=D7CLC9_SYNLT|nr:homocysteine S-methyltransferase family protein [Syntrophothermus lipocalidus]ADI01514.1 homocysteine S-methyltransferase [Syntrophothermus lipocalidus DSM 12680]
MFWVKGVKHLIKDLASLLRERIIILDGAMGTMLQERGLRPGDCPELFGLEHPEVLEEIHGQYIEAGADIIQTNTFGANRFKLTEYGLQDRVAEINKAAVKAAKKVAGSGALVAIDIGPTGRLLQPAGDATFDQLYEAFREQVVAGAEAGADLVSIETMTDIGELRAAVIAARENTDLPILAHLTFEPNGRTMMGTSPAGAALVLEALGVTAIGANCSGGAKELLPVIEEMARVTGIFLSVEPNAGLPKLENGRTIFPETPESMAVYALSLREAGANLIGGCCGTTPAHIRAMAEILRGLPPVTRRPKRVRALASRSRYVVLSEDSPLHFIGERINPTARKKLGQDIAQGSMAMVAEEARKQVEAGAPLIDVNVGVPGIDEPSAMEKAVIAVQSSVDVPISIDSANSAAVEAALKAFVGRPLINSTTGEQKVLERILPLAKKYGAAVLGLCLDEKGIPSTAGERFEIAVRILEQARLYGLREEDIYIDCLVKTAGAEQAQVMETIKCVRMVRERLGLATVLGISNVSHGLPAREILNSTYLAMALGSGLDLPIINPFDQRIREVILASGVLLNRDISARKFVGEFKDRTSLPSEAARPRSWVCEKCNIPLLVAGKPPGGVDDASRLPVVAGDEKIKQEEGSKGADIAARIEEAVVKGEEHLIVGLVKEALAAGIAALEVVNKSLIPGIEKVGELYEKQEYFLPQLMLSAETMKKGFATVRPFLTQQAQQQFGTIIMATVEGDIHDIGKNIVSLMLENYGFKVIDLGKNVPAQRIVEEAVRSRADIVGLSALMTTTMPRMGEVIERLREKGLGCRVMVGGAVLTQEYAERIGADAYARDAREAVIKARKLCNLD